MDSRLGISGMTTGGELIAGIFRKCIFCELLDYLDWTASNFVFAGYNKVI